MRSSTSRCRRRTFLPTGWSTWPPPSVCVAEGPRRTNGWPHVVVAGSDAAGYHRSGHDGAVALDDERAVDRQAEPGRVRTPGSRGLALGLASLRERRFQVLEPRTCLRGRADDRRALQEAAAYQL